MTHSQLQALCDAANALRVIREPMRLRLHKVKPQGELRRGGCRTNPVARKYK